ncbi:hypothetical protein AAUPMB_07622, partial [Pasteurella multocida subsp. multocida str. Anand1_buffalo]
YGEGTYNVDGQDCVVTLHNLKDNFTYA